MMNGILVIILYLHTIQKHNNMKLVDEAEKGIDCDVATVNVVN